MRCYIADKSTEGIVSGNERWHRDLSIASITKTNKNVKEACMFKAFFQLHQLKDLIPFHLKAKRRANNGSHGKRGVPAYPII